MTADWVAMARMLEPCRGQYGVLEVVNFAYQLVHNARDFDRTRSIPEQLFGR